MKIRALMQMESLIKLISCHYKKGQVVIGTKGELSYDSGVAFQQYLALSESIKVIDPVVYSTIKPRLVALREELK